LFVDITQSEHVFGNDRYKESFWLEREKKREKERDKVGEIEIEIEIGMISC
jgi:hypothetical protein